MVNLRLLIYFCIKTFNCYKYGAQTFNIHLAVHVYKFIYDLVRCLASICVRIYVFLNVALQLAGIRLLFLRPQLILWYTWSLSKMY